MNAELTKFLDYVMPHVVGCTTEMAIMEIRNSIIDFCEKTLLLQTTVDPISTTADVADYDIDVDTGYIPITVMKMWFKGYPVFPKAPDDVETPSVYNPYSGAVVRQGDPEKYLHSDASPTTFTLYPVPDKTDALSITLRVALKPTRTASTIKQIIFEDYAETIGHGAIARLALSQNKPYTNNGVAQVQNALYMAGVNAARVRANKGLSRANMQVKMRKI